MVKAGRTDVMFVVLQAVQQVVNKKEVERTSQELMRFKPLNSVKNVFNPGTLEDDLDQTKDPVLGKHSSG